MSGSASPRWAVVWGALSVVTMPIAVGATRYSSAYTLLHSGFAIPVGLAFGWAAIVQARRARTRSLAGTGGRRTASVGRMLGIIGICIACSGLISLAVYGVLTYLGSTN